MKKNLVSKPVYSSFLSCEVDTQTILRKLFIESQPYSDVLKGLLVIDKKDVLDSNNRLNPKYQDAIIAGQVNEDQEKFDDIPFSDMGIADLREREYIRLVTSLNFTEHEPVKSYVILTFGNFHPCPTNPEFRDCTLSFDIICNREQWELTDCRVRPIKIAGYIDGILNNTKLSGLGTLQFASLTENYLPNGMMGYTLQYVAVHGTDDQEPGRVPLKKGEEIDAE